MIHDDKGPRRVHQGDSTCLGVGCPECVTVDERGRRVLVVDDRPRLSAALLAAAALAAPAPQVGDGRFLRGDPAWWGSRRSKGVSRAERERRKAKRKMAKVSRRRNRR